METGDTDMYYRGLTNYQYHVEVHLRYHRPELVTSGMWNHDIGNYPLTLLDIHNIGNYLSPYIRGGSGSTCWLLVRNEGTEL